MYQGNLLTKRIAHISKLTQYHMDEVLKPFCLSSGTYPFLFALMNDEGINLEKISRKANVDKSMSTRAIQKLIELGYIEKQSDLHDLRAYKLYLTNKAKEVIPIIKKEISEWIDSLTVDLNEDEVKILDNMLDKLLIRAEQKRL